uniref:Capping protein regulator and myosin 1 linker 2 n=1 Tax=Echeneis naucrates TaxID=173247 RepID=A0A665UXG4_ECHNA
MKMHTSMGNVFSHVCVCQCVQVESSFSYLEICSINIHSLTQIVLETDRQTWSFSVLHVEDLEAMVSHITASLKRIYPDSSPGKLLKTVPPDLQQRLFTLTTKVDEQLNSQPSSCGGFSDTYAALCDFNEMLFREEIQWDVDNIYYIHNWRQFNLQDFSHLDSRDLALAVAALSFNQWFTKIYCKELKLSVDIQQQLNFLLSRSPSLKELSLEACGLKLDFAMKMAAALRENTISSLHSINLSSNPIEDKGGHRICTSHLSSLGCLSQLLLSNQLFSVSLTHLDLSGNPGSMVTEEATFLFKFLSRTNSVSHLDLSDTNCPLDTLFVSLSAGCCFKMVYLNLARNPFSHRKVQKVTRSIREFFSQSYELKYVGLSGTKLPPQALRLLLQGLATNTRLFGLELDLSSCELRSAGAQVIQEHISEATAIKSLDISDNGFENEMVTLVLSVGRCHSLRHLALGRNFAMKSRYEIHQIIKYEQLEENRSYLLSVLCDSKLKTGMHVLLSALGGHAALVELDISGNNMGDIGAKMLAKALMNNSRLRTLTWDRNNVTAKGFQDVADALERNFTLQQVSFSLADITQSYRSNPERTKDALHKVSLYNLMNIAGWIEKLSQLASSFVSSALFVCDVQLVQGMCQHLERSLQQLNPSSIQKGQSDILTAQEVLHNARKCDWILVGSSIRPGLWTGLCLTLDSDLTCYCQSVSRCVFQEMAQGLMQSAEAVCPRLVQRSSVCECLSECVSKRSRQTHTFLRSSLVEKTGQIIINRLCELRQSLCFSLAESIIEQLQQDLTMAQGKVVSKCEQNSHNTLNIPELRLSDSNFPTDDYSPAIWRNSFNTKSLRPASSIKSLLDADCEQHSRDRGTERESSGGAGDEGGGESRCGLPQLPTATPLSLMASTSFIPPPIFPLLDSIHTRAPEEEAAGQGGSPRRETPFPGCGPTSLMEPLPTQGQTLKHYTASRPRPRRTYTQPPSSRPQPVSKVENETTEGMGRVDEGVEEFFTKKILPDFALKGRWEESNPAQATPSESSPPPSASTPFSTSSENITYSITSKKFGDFFAFKRARTSRAAKAGGGEGGGGEGLKVKRTSIADLIRPLREAKERERERERDKEREKERGARSVKDANISNDAVITEGTLATNNHLAADAREAIAAANTLPMPTRPSETTAFSPTIVTTPDCKNAALSNTEEEAGYLSPVVTSPLTKQERGAVLRKELKLGGTPYGERRLSVTKRSLREGKSQSLILLTGLEPEDKDNMHSKKHASDSTSSFEQRLQVMLHRMGVAKIQMTDAKTSQNKEEELRKANSEGAILDKPEPPLTYMKPRTMSTSSADPQYPVRVLDPIQPDPPLHPKPSHPERTIGPLPPKPAIAAKPPLPTPDAPAGGGARPSSAPPASSSAERVQLRSHIQVGGAGEDPVQVTKFKNTSRDKPEKGDSSKATMRLFLKSQIYHINLFNKKYKKEILQQVMQDLPKPRQHMKPLPQRRAVSVHEDSLSMTQELKAVFNRSPIRFRANRGDLPTCTEDPSIEAVAQKARNGERGLDQSCPHLAV